MKNINPLGVFDNHLLMEKLTKLGDSLQKLNEFIDWKIFESSINEAFKMKIMHGSFVLTIGIERAKNKIG